MKRKLGFLLILPLMGTVVAPVRGQNIGSPYRFVERTQAGGAFGGYLSPSRGTVGFGPESGPIGGLRYAIRLSGPFNVEADLGYFASTRAVLDTAVVDSARQRVGTADMTILSLMATLRFNLTGQRTWHRLQPFFVFGAGGVADLSPESPDEENVPGDLRYDFGTSFAGHFGGGLEWYPSDRLTFRIDGRNALWRIKTPLPFLRGELGETTPQSEWVGNGLVSVGLTVRF